MTNSDPRGELQPLIVEVNVALYDLHGSLDLGYSDFFCECGDMRCRERTMLTRAQYASLRKQGRLVLVAAHAQRESSAATAAGKTTIAHMRPAELRVPER